MCRRPKPTTRALRLAHPFNGEPMNDDPVEPLDEQTAAGTALSHRTPPRSLTLGGVVARRASRSRAERRVSA